MASLGSFGVAPAAVEEVEPDSFDYFGETIRVSPRFTDADLVDFLELASSVDENNYMLAMSEMKKLLQAVIYSDDFALFWSTAAANGQSLTDRIEVVNEIVEAMAARPTSRPAGSSGGPGPTRVTSVDDFYAQGMDHFAGRPDLQLIVQNVQDSRLAG